MQGISIREFARLDKCDDKLVRRALAKKKLTAYEDGSLNPADVGTGWRKSNRNPAPADTSADKGADKKPAVRTAMRGRRQTVECERAPETDPETQEEKARNFIERVLAGDFFDLSKAEEVKENALAAKHLLDGRKKSGELIESAMAEAALFEEFRSARDVWLNFPAKVGPIIAAELGIEAERVTEILTAHVHQQLNDLGEPEADFGRPDGEAAAGGAARVDAAAKDQHTGVG